MLLVIYLASHLWLNFNTLSTCCNQYIIFSLSVLTQFQIIMTVYGSLNVIKHEHVSFLNETCMGKRSLKRLPFFPFQITYWFQSHYVY